MKKKIFSILLLTVILLVGWNCISLMRHVNRGESISHGTIRKGSIENAWLLEYSGNNFQYFSPFSYYVMTNAFVHSRVYHTLHMALATCEHTAPGIQYRIMECGNKEGGKMLLHYTHQNGLSVDIMSPKMKKGVPDGTWDQMGLLHYLLNFNPDGKLNLSKQVEIDFESLANLLVAIDDAAKKNSLRIRNIIYRDYLQDNLLNTRAGRSFKNRGIQFWQTSNSSINKMHDDHVHVNFDLI